MLDMEMFRYNEENPVWGKYITEDNLPPELKELASVIGLEATKKLIYKYNGRTFNIPRNIQYKYKKQYVIDNYKGTKTSLNHLILACRVSARYVYKVIKEHVEGEKDWGKICIGII